MTKTTKFKTLPKTSSKKSLDAIFNATDITVTLHNEHNEWKGEPCTADQAREYLSKAWATPGGKLVERDDPALEERTWTVYMGSTEKSSPVEFVKLRRFTGNWVPSWFSTEDKA